MTITSVEALDALPEGSTIRVSDAGTTRWSRVGTGWTRDGVQVPVPSSLFRGLVKMGRVADVAHLDPEAGDVYRNGRYWYLFVQIAGGQCRYVSWRDQTFRARQTTELTRLREGWLANATRVPEGELPAWLRVLRDQRLMFATYENTIAELATRVDALADESAARSRVLQETERRYQALEVERSTDRPATVKITVSGSSPMPPEKAVGHLPAGAQVQEVAVAWRRTLTLETTGSGCVCSAVTPDWLAAQLGVSQDTVSTFAWTADCGRH